jgi:nicotinate-nucleotide adenylyltransferase
MGAEVSGRLGVFGGTFDPPHIGHRVVAQDVVEGLELDSLLVVPAGRPPHREAALDPDTRLQLTRTAFAGDDRIRVLDVEVRREGPSWTVDTLEWVRAELSPDELYLVVGADQLAAFGGWRNPERILELSTLAVMARSGEERKEAEIPHEWIEVTRVDLSSTRIRRRLEEGRSIRYMVPDSIRPAIERAWAERRAAASV